MALISANTFKFIFNFNFLREKSVISDIISCFPMQKKYPKIAFSGPNFLKENIRKKGKWSKSLPTYLL